MAELSRRGAMLGAAGLLVSSGAVAARYPDRPVKIVVGFAPAGPTDIMARIMAAHLGERLGGSFIVENRPGAAGNIGMSAVAHADPDGYTLLLASSTVVVNPALYKRLPYDPVKDLAPISELATSPNVFVANPKSGIGSIAELVAKARAAPDSISYGSPGIGSTPHLSGEMLKLYAGIKMTHVPFSGAGPAVQAVLAGTTDIACTALAPAQPHIVSGALKGLAVTGETRWPDVAGVPTMVELGYPKLVTDTFQGFFAPARTPPDVMAALVQACMDILHDKAVAEQLRASGFEVLATQPEAFRKKIEADIPMWREVIAKAGISQV